MGLTEAEPAGCLCHHYCDMGIGDAALSCAAQRALQKTQRLSPSDQCGAQNITCALSKAQGLNLVLKSNCAELHQRQPDSCNDNPGTHKQPRGWRHQMNCPPGHCFQVAGCTWCVQRGCPLPPSYAWYEKCRRTCSAVSSFWPLQRHVVSAERVMQACRWSAACAGRVISATPDGQAHSAVP